MSPSSFACRFALLIPGLPWLAVKAYSRSTHNDYYNLSGNPNSSRFHIHKTIKLSQQIRPKEKAKKRKCKSGGEAFGYDDDRVYVPLTGFVGGHLGLANERRTKCRGKKCRSILVMKSIFMAGQTPPLKSE